MVPLWKYTIIYCIVVFILGFLWHLVFLKKLYASFGNFDALHKPRFEFGMLSMVVQGIALGMIYNLVVAQSLSIYAFATIVFLILVSFIAFAELGKHHVKRIPLFLLIQVVYCIIQTILVTGVFYSITR